MKTLHPRPLAPVLLVGGGVPISACQRRDATDTVHEKIDRAAENIAGVRRVLDRIVVQTPETG